MGGQTSAASLILLTNRAPEGFEGLVVYRRRSRASWADLLRVVWCSCSCCSSYCWHLACISSVSENY